MLGAGGIVGAVAATELKTAEKSIAGINEIFITDFLVDWKLHFRGIIQNVSPNGLIPTNWKNDTPGLVEVKAFFVSSANSPMLFDTAETQDSPCSRPIILILWN